MNKIEYIQQLGIFSDKQCLEYMQDGIIEIDSSSYDMLEKIAEEQDTTVEQVFSEAIMFYLAIRDKPIEFYQDSTQDIVN